MSSPMPVYFMTDGQFITFARGHKSRLLVKSIRMLDEETVWSNLQAHETFYDFHSVLAVTVTSCVAMSKKRWREYKVTRRVPTK